MAGSLDASFRIDSLWETRKPISRVRDRPLFSRRTGERGREAPVVVSLPACKTAVSWTARPPDSADKGKFPNEDTAERDVPPLTTAAPGCVDAATPGCVWTRNASRPCLALRSLSRVYRLKNKSVTKTLVHFPCICWEVGVCFFFFNSQVRNQVRCKLTHSQLCPTEAGVGEGVWTPESGTSRKGGAGSGSPCSGTAGVTCESEALVR